jgi:hypothetical protein
VKTETKVQIANVTLFLLTFVTSLFLMGLLVLVICTGLQINPFRETTTSMLFAAFAGLIGAAGILVLLNVAMNISLIADARIAELAIAPKGTALRRWFIGFLAVAAALVCLIFVGEYYSKEKYLGVVRAQADEVLKENDGLLQEIGALLASGRPEDYKRIIDIRDFLQKQRSGLPNLRVIYSGEFGDKLAFYELAYYSVNSMGKNIYNPAFFSCTPNFDCDYLRRFFSGEKVEILQKYTIRNDQFYIYIPFVSSNARFILLFSRSNSYGKLGS